MNDAAGARATANAEANITVDEDAPVCGLIMPISQTASHAEVHWQAVQTLLHRGITSAGFMPRNVWESTAKDRISERIIGNIFQVPMAVADITDLNPNVMLELGLRLASKKPTVVIATAGSTIPFDIRDFHVTFYPADMNMLGMEEFFRKLAKVLREKQQAVTSDNYTPFLGNVIVDVASPETREVGANDIILSHLEEISRRLSAVEVSARRARPSGTRTRRPTQSYSGSIAALIPEASADEFIEAVTSLWEVDKAFRRSEKEGIQTIDIEYSYVDSHGAITNKISEIAESFGGELDIPF